MAGVCAFCSRSDVRKEEVGGLLTEGNVVVHEYCLVSVVPRE